MEPNPHYFFAVRIPDETKRTMKAHIEKLEAILPFRRWVNDQDIHITLAFLGSAACESLTAAKTNVQEVIKNAKKFRLEINQLGTFGREQSPRVLWADIEYSSELHDIRNKVFSACEQAGFKLETRPFRPHITLARKWTGEEAFQSDKLVIWKKLQPDSLPFQVSEVVLYRTHLNQLPKYEAIAIFPLET